MVGKWPDRGLSSSRADIAVIKIPADHLPDLAFGDSSKIKGGDFAHQPGRGNLGIEDSMVRASGDPPILLLVNRQGKTLCVVVQPEGIACESRRCERGCRAPPQVVSEEFF